MDSALTAENRRRPVFRRHVHGVVPDPGMDIEAAPGFEMKSLEIAGLDVIADGVLVSTRGRTFDQNRVYRAHRAGTSQLQLAVLTDGESASASEIVAGAIRDHRRGVIIGRRTFGKWSVQSIFPLAIASGLRITTARFYSPAGHNLSKVGVRPDISVAEPKTQDGVYRRPTHANLSDDADVRKALDELRARLAG